MPAVIRKSKNSMAVFRRDVLQAVSWQFRPNVWNPASDSYETEEAYIVRMEIAGMREEDFEIYLENDVLLITGSRSDSAERRAYHQMEIRFGTFAVPIPLAGPVQFEKIHAEYRDGFLTITLPKARPTQIKVED